RGFQRAGIYPLNPEKIYSHSIVHENPAFSNKIEPEAEANKKKRSFIKIDNRVLTEELMIQKGKEIEAAQKQKALEKERKILRRKFNKAQKEDQKILLQEKKKVEREEKRPKKKLKNQKSPEKTQQKRETVNLF